MEAEWKLVPAHRVHSLVLRKSFFLSFFLLFSNHVSIHDSAVIAFVLLIIAIIPTFRKWRQSDLAGW